MLSIAHGLTSAFLATTLPPPLGIPAALAAHYVEDWIPHWDVGTGLSSGRRKRSTAILMEIVDLSITIGLVYAFFQYGHNDINWLAWGGMFLGLLPDFLEAPRNFLNWEPRVLKIFNEFHGKFHHSTHQMLYGLLPQVVVVATVFFLK